ncbi:hypothetical protein ANCDUO_22616 [Ancylostoma duodenale]|uniref:Uncharacterized protein n=1 Tax=Ancylostoma duodenale TaxID=51022 RepID=A0A0C2FKM2_9BILA|nr:hypothetical protein ANCDUO_22616 [Ancylostoma duodenale]
MPEQFHPNSPMRSVVLVAIILVSVCAQNDDVKCNYPATGDEVVESAVPIATFRTSGEDFVRPTWCITHCKDRKSIKAAMTFQPSNGNAMFCMDDNVAAISDSVFQKYDDIEKISEALNYYINKPGWAYLVYQKKAKSFSKNEAMLQLGPPPLIVNTDNVHIDPNFCMKHYEKMVWGKSVEFQMFAGLVKRS